MMSSVANVAQSGGHVSNAQPPNNPLVYKKRRGTSGISGQLYEISLAMWFLLHGQKLTKDGALKSFRLATNMEKAGAFDDVFFQYEPSDDQENTKVFLIQAKHKDSTSKNVIKFSTLSQEESNVYLPKYFPTYLRVKKQFNSFQNLDFVIYTNALLDENSEQHFIKHSISTNSIDSDSIWNINTDNFYFKLNFNENKKHLVQIIKYSTDCGQLARALAKCIESGSDIEIKSRRFKKYHYSIKTRVFASDRINNDFMNGHSLSQEEIEFKKSLIEELQQLPKYESKSETQIISEFKTMSFTISNPIKQSTPGDALPGDSVQEADIQGFLSKLKFFFNQPNVSQLNDKIKAKLGSWYGLESSDSSDIIFNRVHKEVQNWWENKEEENDFLTEKNKWFEEAKQDLSKLKLVGLALSLHYRMSSHGLEFNSNKLDIFTRAIHDHNIQIFHIETNETTLLLNQMVLHQALESMNAYKAGNSDLRYIFMYLSDVLKLETKVLEAFKTSECNLLAIVCDTNKEKVELYKHLSSIVCKYERKRIVLLAKDSNRIKTYFEKEFKSKGIYKEIPGSRFDLNDLTDKSQGEILEKNIKLQGKQVQLKQVILQGNATTRLITAAELTLLINNDGLNIGGTLPDLGDIADYYIDRTFEQRRTIKKECFQKSYIDDWFAVSNIQEDELQRLVSKFQKVRKFSNKHEKVKNSKYVVLDNTLTEEEDFKSLCNETKNRIHWLKKTTKGFTWQKSRGSLYNLYSFISDSVESVRDNKFKDRVVILGGEPGMGKTTSFIKLSNIAKTDDSSYWVMHINLSAQIPRLNKLKSTINEDEVICFLMEAKGIGTTLEQEIFKLKLNKQQLVIYMDAFDEISPKYQEEVLKILEILQQTKVRQIFVSTRLHMTRNLEERLSVLSYNLKPLNINDQKLFLKKYWSKYLKRDLKSDEDQTEPFITGLLNVFCKSISDREAAFTGIPLQTRMLAEVYQQKFEEFLESSGDRAHIPDQIDLFELYKNFIDKKMEIHCEEKLKLDKSNVNTDMEYVLKKLRQKYLSNHGLFAMDVLYTNHLNDLLSEDEKKILKNLKEDVDRGKENRGIVNKIFQNELILVHRTFAEFFSADYFTNYINKQSIQTLLAKKYFAADFLVQRHFLDRLLCNAEDDTFAIHRAVLNDNIPKLKDLLSSKAEAINTVDKGGRTALYLAAAQGNWDMVQILLEQKAHVNTRDKVCGRTPLSYADSSNNWRLVEMLLQSGADGSDLSKALSIINQRYGSNVNTLLHIAAANGYTKLIELLLNRGANLHLVNYKKCTALHEAVIHNKFEVTKLLIKHKDELEALDRYNQTPLHNAAISNSIETVRYIVEHNANIDARDDNNRTPLHNAVIDNSIETVRYIVENKANIEACDNNNRTPLHYAAINNSIKIFQYLVEHNANIEACDNDLQTPLHNAAINNSIEVFQYLLVHNANIEACDIYSRTPLHNAAINNSIGIVVRLLEDYTNIEACDNNNQTPLHYAVINNSIRIVRYLVEHNANIEACDKNNRTPLLHAAINNSFDVVQCLVVHYSNIDSRDIDNLTPLSLAVAHVRNRGPIRVSNSRIIKYLVKHGAGIPAFDTEGRTELDKLVEDHIIPSYKVLDEA